VVLRAFSLYSFLCGKSFPNPTQSQLISHNHNLSHTNSHQPTTNNTPLPIFEACFQITNSKIINLTLLKMSNTKIMGSIKTANILLIVVLVIGVGILAFQLFSKDELPTVDPNVKVPVTKSIFGLTYSGK